MRESLHECFLQNVNITYVQMSDDYMYSIIYKFRPDHITCTSDDYMYSIIYKFRSDHITCTCLMTICIALYTNLDQITSHAQMSDR